VAATLKRNKATEEEKREYERLRNVEREQILIE
jgi:hypothetical protein